MKGFFSGEEVVHRVRKTRGSKETSSNIKSMDPCEQCGLYKGCVSPKMEVTGKGGKKILIIAEAPGKTEDEQGIQLIGEAGQILRNCLEELDYNLDRDFWKTNIINCRPPGNRNPLERK
jgi:uracil-DNA glycosylase